MIGDFEDKVMQEILDGSGIKTITEESMLEDDNYSEEVH